MILFLNGQSILLYDSANLVYLYTLVFSELYFKGPTKTCLGRPIVFLLCWGAF